MSTLACRRASIPLILLALSVASCTRRTAEEYVSSGDRYFQNKQYLEAVLEYRNAATQDPRSGQTRLKLAEAYMKAGSPADAADAYRKAAERLPNDTEVQLKVVSMLLLSGEYDEARQRTDRILQREPKNFTAQVLRANTLAGKRDYAGARTEIEPAISLDPLNSDKYYVNLGTVHVAAGLNDEAEAAYKKAVELDPASLPATLSLASFYWARNRMPEAERLFKKAIEIDHGNLPANRALAVFYLGSNRGAEAEKHLKAIAESSPTGPALIALADYYIKLNRLDEAIVVLNRATKVKDGYAEARSRLAAIAYDAGRTAEGHQIIDETLQRDRWSARALLTKGEFLLTEQKIDEALPRVKQAVVADQRSAPAHYMLGSIYALKRDVPMAIKEFSEVLKLTPHSVAAQRELARLHLAAGNAAAATDLADQAADAQPHDTHSRVLVIRSLLGTDDMKRAEIESRTLQIEHPELPEAHWLAGNVHARKKETAAARADYERALSLKPDAIEPLESLLTLELSSGNNARARTVVEDRLAKQPNNPNLLMMAARSYAAAKDTEKAEATLRRVLEVDPSNPLPYAMLAQIYLWQHQLDRAIVEFEEMIKREPKSVPAHTMIGLILEMQGRPVEAQKRYEQTLSFAPRAAVAANNLAWLHVTRGGNLDVALQLAQTAKSQLPMHPTVNDTLGYVYVRKGLPTLALEPLMTCVRSDPKNPLFQFHLGLAYAKVGESDNARKALGEALRLNPDFDGSAEARHVLAAMD